MEPRPQAAGRLVNALRFGSLAPIMKLTNMKYLRLLQASKKAKAKGMSVCYNFSKPLNNYTLKCVRKKSSFYSVNRRKPSELLNAEVAQEAAETVL